MMSVPSGGRSASLKTNRDHLVGPQRVGGAGV